VSFVFSSHDPQLFAAADDVLTLRDGRLEPPQHGRRPAR